MVDIHLGSFISACKVPLLFSAAKRISITHEPTLISRALKTF